ncbi:MAG: hypothetical protein DWQ53_20700 [Microcystis flos-aquae DF17]|uniref:Uncharacterized protein n=1 Tax=Microcystis aeruginosa (strain NIES-843 / IAM M-2473) TaxID=449447 RepID=B0JGL6_MICAN|nr:MAG: hypothetical protein DWQ53_20700 [Microcystis flos-aquae DF17]BAG05282.1 unknown protein [Microcystis aeruginosa NIES-843]
MPETNVEKSLRGTQNPGTFALRSRRVPLPDVRGHSVILTSPPDDRRPTTGDRLLTPPINFFSRPYLRGWTRKKKESRRSKK